jgi:hypothetical protein
LSAPPSPCFVKSNRSRQFAALRRALDVRHAVDIADSRETGGPLFHHPRSMSAIRDKVAGMALAARIYILPHPDLLWICWIAGINERLMTFKT